LPDWLPPGAVDESAGVLLLLLDDQALVMNKHRANRLGFAILLTFFRDRVRFPRDESEVEPRGIAALSRQLNVPPPVDGEAFLAGRTAERLRAEIRFRFGFRETTSPTPTCCQPGCAITSPGRLAAKSSQ
jgi:hypothetical protein